MDANLFGIELEELPPVRSVEPAKDQSVESPNQESVESPNQESGESPKQESVESPNQESVESPNQSVKAPAKKIDFEITNPGDIDIDDKGQLGLF